MDGDGQPPGGEEPSLRERVDAAEVGRVLEAAGAQVARHRAPAGLAAERPLAPRRAEEPVILDGEHRARPGRGPLEDDRVHHVVDVHDVGHEAGQEIVEIHRGRLARLEARADVHRARRREGTVVLPHHQAHLVVHREALEDSREPGVGAPSIRPPVRQVQDPHRPAEA